MRKGNEAKLVRLDRDDADGSTSAITRSDSQSSLVEGKDYYLEGAAMVFTAHFLRRRGYCCESGCRHCPYSEVEGREED